MDTTHPSDTDCSAWLRRTTRSLVEVQSQVQRWAPNARDDMDEVLMCQEQLWQHWDQLSFEHTRRAPAALLPILNTLAKKSRDTGIASAANAAALSLAGHPIACLCFPYL